MLAAAVVKELLALAVRVGLLVMEEGGRGGLGEDRRRGRPQAELRLGLGLFTDQEGAAATCRCHRPRGGLLLCGRRHGRIEAIVGVLVKHTVPVGVRGLIQARHCLAQLRRLLVKAGRVALAKLARPLLLILLK